MRISTLAVGLAACLGLAACGDTLGERAIIGAGAGAAAAVLLSGNLGAGVFIGAGANVLFCDQNPRRC